MSNNNNNDNSNTNNTVKKAKSAFMYFQGQNLGQVRQELGPEASMGDAMTTLACRWRDLSDADRQVYLDLHEQDMQRYLRESREADAAALEAAEARRQAQTEITGQRGARAAVDAERIAKEQRRVERRAAAEADDSEAAIRRREIKQQKQQEVDERRKKREDEEQALAKQHKRLNREEAKKASNRLEYLLKQSSIFEKLRGGGKEALPSVDEDTKPAAAASTNPKKAHHTAVPAADEEVVDDSEEDRHVFLSKQPSTIKSGQLKPYQLEALNWMIHLAEKGLNGILADEMGLGKTVQSIAIMAYHWEFLRIQGPHLICVPKSTLSNWMNELKRWCPSLRAIKFHGSREDREYMIDNYFTNEAAAHDGRRPDRQIKDENGELIDDNTGNPRTWDVCVTTYEVANTERRTLQKFAWKYLVIDEAHRLKNDVSMFSKTVRSFRTANRLLLTGTPLQNNLHELWALLNFLLPDIFSSADQFDDWFDLEIDDEEAKKNIITQLHKVLRPFMLRRLKVDVAKGLPPKTETILMVGMSKMQKKLYKQLLLRDLDSITGSNGSRTAVLNIVMQLRKCCGHPYLFEGLEDRTLDPLGEHLVENCGKLSMLAKLLKRLFERGNRVLIFSQMSRILDILEDFMVMRGYKYCRIDGNTTYDDRENSIAEFNREGSEKFCFLLSTRAGGLGINLQTADTCVLYDSDWNPQADLQAQDRCHRLGQKKPVNVFRLVSENTIEEKIVERAQQKLKLDAMVVQQGRLKEQDKVSKEEIMNAVRFGADTVFRSEESTITDDDIDIILERGKAKTKELAEKIQKRDKGDLLDFRLDGGISAQTFEGIDYSDKELRDHLRMLAADSMGKRERRPPPSSYNPIIISKKSMVVNNQRIKLPKALRIPQMEDHHFYNRERLLELGKLEFENYAALRATNSVPPKEVIEREQSLLPPEIAQDKRELLAEGFGTWSRSQYYHFIKACAKFGRDDIVSIANDMDMPVEDVQPYSVAFWKYGPTELKSEWDRVVANIERGEKKLAKQKRLSELLSKFVSTFDDPRNDMVFANKGTAHFALEQDRALLCAVEKHGYGNWESVREEIRTDDRLKFQHSVQGMTVQAIAKRVDYRMRQMEKELEAREKALKSKQPANVIAAQAAIEAIKAMDMWDIQTREAQLEGESPPPLTDLSGEARNIMKERLKERSLCENRLREIEVQVQRALCIADETRQQIYDGAQYVNYSNITLKPAGQTASNADKQVNTSTVKDGVDLEERINPMILKVKQCNSCQNCLKSTTRLCERRLEVRDKLVAEAILHSKSDGGKKKVSKKRKAETTEVKKKVSAPKAKASAPKAQPSANPAPKQSANPAPKQSANPAPKQSANPAPKKKKAKLMVMTPDGLLKSRVTSQGNKRMLVPEELVPDLCRRISAQGTGEREKLIRKFAEDNPGVSMRQITIKFGDVATRDRPSWMAADTKAAKKPGRAFMFYLRPAFYKFLAPEELPSNWEQLAADDEAKMRQEKLEKAEKKKSEKAHGKKESQDGGDETEDDDDDEISKTPAASPAPSVGDSST